MQKNHVKWLGSYAHVFLEKPKSQKPIAHRGNSALIKGNENVSKWVR